MLRPGGSLALGGEPEGLVLFKVARGPLRRNLEVLEPQSLTRIANSSQGLSFLRLVSQLVSLGLLLPRRALEELCLVYIALRLLSLVAERVVVGSQE